jgi:hypothetical protein
MSEKRTTTTEELLTQSTNYCEVCGIEVNSNTNLKRFGKLFCSDEHLSQYVRARQKKMGLIEEEVGVQLIKEFDSSLRNLLFDFCLAALDGDNLNAKLYLRHSYYLLGLRRRLTLLLSIIVNEPSLKEDKDVRQLLTLLAVMTEPNNIDVYFDLNDGGFTKKYSTYLEELQKLIPTNQGISVPRREEKEEPHFL